jgi:8-oxo-dGTP diphosphatase
MYSKGSVTTMSPDAHGSDTRSYKLLGDVHLLLLDSAGRALFVLRQNTGLMDGEYHVPAGHLEAGESVVQTVIREAKEELGISVDPEDVEFAHIMHSPITGGRASFFFRIRQWKGLPANREPRKCRELRWFPLDELPETATRYCRVALKQIAAGESFSVDDWDAQPETQPDTRPEADLPAAKRPGRCSPVPAAMPGLRGGLIATPKAAPGSAFRVTSGY